MGSPGTDDLAPGALTWLGPATFRCLHRARPTRPLKSIPIALIAAALLGGPAAAQTGLANGRSRASRRGEPEFQLGLLGSRSAADRSQESGVGFFAGLRLPIRRWLFADLETGHVYRVSRHQVDSDPGTPPPPVGPFVRTFAELSEPVPLVLPTGFFAARLSGQIPIGAGANLRLQLGTRRRNASRIWLPTAGLAVQFPSRSTPVFIELEVARYQVPYEDVKEDFLDGALINRTSTPSPLKPTRGPEVVLRFGLSFGPAQRSRRR